jgi:hypothetical protein
VATFALNIAADSTVSAISLGYGGSVSPAIAGGGFATSLSLYDALGNRLASDFLGGTAVGPTCSNGAQQDSTTGFCEDAIINFFATAGAYTLTLSEQGNDGPDPLSYGFLLSPGDNFAGGPFLDPGSPGVVHRTGNWALDLTVNGSITPITGTPEPATSVGTMLGLSAGLIAMRRLRKPATIDR